jgi:hypothetical protein
LSQYRVLLARRPGLIEPDARCLRSQPA